MTESVKGAQYNRTFIYVVVDVCMSRGIGGRMYGTR